MFFFNESYNIFINISLGPGTEYVTGHSGTIHDTYPWWHLVSPGHSEIIHIYIYMVNVKFHIYQNMKKNDWQTSIH